MRKALLIVICLILAIPVVSLATDLRSNIAPTIVINPKSVSDNTAEVGAIIDRKGYESVTFIIQVGTNTDNTSLTPTLEMCAESNCSDAATATNLIGTIAGATVSITTPVTQNVIKSIGYNGTKRYLRLTLTPGAANSQAIFFSASAILGDAINRPVQ